MSGVEENHEGSNLYPNQQKDKRNQNVNKRTDRLVCRNPPHRVGGMLWFGTKGQSGLADCGLAGSG